MRRFVKAIMLLVTLAYGSVLLVAIAGGAASAHGAPPENAMLGVLLASGLGVWATAIYLPILAVLALVLIGLSLAAPSPKPTRQRVRRKAAPRRPGPRRPARA